MNIWPFDSTRRQQAENERVAKEAHLKAAIAFADLARQRPPCQAIGRARKHVTADLHAELYPGPVAR